MTNLKLVEPSMSNNELSLQGGIPIDHRYIFITEAARFVRKTMEQMNAAEKWIIIGGKLAEVKERLVQMQGGDRRSKKAYDGPTWEKEFKVRNRPYPFSVKTADRLVILGKFFNSRIAGVDPNSPYLPASWYTLFILADGFKDQPNLFQEVLRSGKIQRSMTREEAKKVIKEAIRGKGDNPPTKPRSKKEKTEKRWPLNSMAPKKNRIATIFEIMAFMKVTIDDLVAQSGDKIVPKTETE